LLAAEAVQKKESVMILFFLGTRRAGMAYQHISRIIVQEANIEKR
jgi:hypothetical protein